MSEKSARHGLQGLYKKCKYKCIDALNHRKRKRKKKTLDQSKTWRRIKSVDLIKTTRRTANRWTDRVGWIKLCFTLQPCWRRSVNTIHTPTKTHMTKRKQMPHACLHAWRFVFSFLASGFCPNNYSYTAITTMSFFIQEKVIQTGAAGVGCHLEVRRTERFNVIVTSRKSFLFKMNKGQTYFTVTYFVSLFSPAIQKKVILPALRQVSLNSLQRNHLSTSFKLKAAAQKRWKASDLFSEVYNPRQDGELHRAISSFSYCVPCSFPISAGYTCPIYSELWPKTGSNSPSHFWPITYPLLQLEGLLKCQRKARAGV